MREDVLRRCAILEAEPFETLEFDIAALLRGESGLVGRRGWRVRAPHLHEPVEVTASELTALGNVEAEGWSSRATLDAQMGSEIVASLLGKGLLVESGSDGRSLDAREQAVRDLHWHPAAAIAHHASLWRGTDVDAARRQARPDAVEELVARVGPPPPHFYNTSDAIARHPLPQPGPATGLDSVFERRTTCRNFDESRALATSDASRLLDRAFGVKGMEEIAPGAVALKKNHPSGGALHAIEAYLIVQHVEGIPAGLYHYDASGHGLEQIARLDAQAVRAIAMHAVAGQDYFARAHVLVVMGVRFARSYWKYRNHAKIYRALILEAGHISQNIYLSAAESGLGAFITAAINERDLETAFGMDGITQSPIAVCGFGIRADHRATVEFDPAGRVWDRTGRLKPDA